MSAKLIGGLIFYLFFISLAITTITFGLGMSGSEYHNVTYQPPARSWWSDIPFIGGVIDTGSLVLSVMGSVSSLIVWNVSEAVFPWWANIIFIKIPLIILTAAIVEMLLS